MARPATTWVPLRTGPVDLLCTWFMLASYSSDSVCCNEPVWWFGGNCIQISHSGNWWACDELTVTWDRSADTGTVILGQMNWSLWKILRVCMCVCVLVVFFFSLGIGWFDNHSVEMSQSWTCSHVNWKIVVFVNHWFVLRVEQGFLPVTLFAVGRKCQRWSSTYIEKNNSWYLDDDDGTMLKTV